MGEEQREKLDHFFTFKFRIWVTLPKKKKKDLGLKNIGDRRGWMLLGAKTRERIKEGSLNQTP